MIPRTKNGPPLAGYGAITMASALMTTITTLPTELRRSLTWGSGQGDVGTRPVLHRYRVKVYFADPKSRGSWNQ